MVILCVVALGGGGLWYVAQKSSSPEQAQQNTEAKQQEETANNNMSGQGSFTDLMEFGESVRCTYSAQYETGSMQGVTYVDGKNNRIRTDGTAQGDSMPATFGVIMAADVMYWWSDTPSGVQGMKMPIARESGEVQPTYAGETESSGPVSMDERVDYHCEHWGVDESVFIPPSDISFTDMNEMYSQMMQSMPEGYEMPEGFPVAQ